MICLEAEGSAAPARKQPSMSMDTSEGPESLDIRAVVVDFGKFNIKAGISGAFVPKAVFPSVVGRPRQQGMTLPGLELKSLYVGDQAVRLRGVLFTRSWFDYHHRIVWNFEDVECIWHHIFYNEVGVAPEKHPVILTQPPLFPKGNTQRIVQLMFETFRVPALHVAVDAVLALFSSGRSTGIVVDCGDHQTNVVPIHSGVIVAHAVKFGIGGLELTEYTITLLTESGITCRPGTRDIDQGLKELLGYVAIDFEDEIRLAREESLPAGVVKEDQWPEFPGQSELAISDISGRLVWQGVADRSQIISDLLNNIGEDKVGCCKQLIIGGVLAEQTCPLGSYLQADEKSEATLVMKRLITKPFEYPDGTVVPICSQRFRCAEPLFQPSLLGSSRKGIHELILQSIAECDECLQPELFSHVYLLGGSASFPGIQERVTKELRTLVPLSTSFSVTAARSPKHSAWIGGSMLASLNIFPLLCTTMADYEEKGPDAVHENGLLNGKVIEALHSQLASAYGASYTEGSPAPVKAD